jgi:hypothetical protein
VETNQARNRRNNFDIYVLLAFTGNAQMTVDLKVRAFVMTAMLAIGAAGFARHAVAESFAVHDVQVFDGSDHACASDRAGPQRSRKRSRPSMGGLKVRSSDTEGQGIFDTIDPAFPVEGRINRALN